MSLPLSRPALRRQDFDQVLDAMVHDRLSSGEITRQLAREAAKALSLKETRVFASASDAIGHLIRGLGLSPGDKVVLSPLAPPYWEQTLTRLGLVPLWADVLESSPVLDPAAVEAVLVETPKLIVADCCLGYLPDVQSLSAWGVPLLEDIGQGLGGSFAGQPVGTRGDAVLACFSPETLVAGAGGALAGFRSRVGDDADEPRWEYLSDLGSALVLSQWKDAAAFAEKKRELFGHLFHRLPKGYKPPRQHGDAETVMPWFPVLVESGAKEVLAHARKKAVEADWAFRHQATLASAAPDFCPRARFFLFHTIVFPLYSIVSSKELELLGKVIGSLP